MSELPPERKCPICGKRQDARLRPFCSRRCADIDLGRWLKGSYFIPGKDTDETEPPPRSDALGEEGG